MASYYLEKAKEADKSEFLTYLYLYLREMLYAGENQKVIEKIHQILDEQGQTMDADESSIETSPLYHATAFPFGIEDDSLTINSVSNTTV